MQLFNFQRYIPCSYSLVLRCLLKSYSAFNLSQVRPVLAPKKTELQYLQQLMIKGMMMMIKMTIKTTTTMMMMIKVTIKMTKTTMMMMMGTDGQRLQIWKSHAELLQEALVLPVGFAPQVFISTLDHLDFLFFIGFTPQIFILTLDHLDFLFLQDLRHKFSFQLWTTWIFLFFVGFVPQVFISTLDHLDF